MTAIYGLFRCPVCPLEDCGDDDGCYEPFVDELWRMWEPEEDGIFPTCPCCGAKAQLVSPLVTLESVLRD